MKERVEEREIGTVRSRRMTAAVVAACAIGVSLLGATVAAANQTRLFRVNSRAGFLQGTLEGIGIDSLGTLRLADQATRLAEIDEPFLLSAATHPRGWVIGTGNSGRVFLVTRGGETELLLAAEEPEIFAVWATADGTVYAGSSPDGRVYRYRDGEVTVLFEPGETYIWSLGESHDGSLLVATGTRGKLFEIDAEGRGSVLFDSEDTHLRSMKVLADGEILLGTAGEGLILKLTPGGAVRTLYDAAHPEVVAFATAPDGSCYAALLASEASLVDLSRASEQEKAEGEEEGEGSDTGGAGSASVQVVTGVDGEAAGSPVGSRPPGFAGARSEVVRISPEGVVETLVRFQEETVYALIWQRERLWIGTGLEGKVFSIADHRPVLEKDVDERQVVALLADSPGPAFATTNAAAVYRLGGRTERTGIYTSATLDAEQVSRFGTLRWLGELPSGTSIEFSFRSGMSAEPDATWTTWTESLAGEEISLGDLSSGRYVQWRARLGADDGRSPSLSEVTLAYRQANLPPTISRLTVLDPGEILVPANFNPARQVYEPASPNRQGIFTTIGPPAAVDREPRLKELWKRGFRTLRWTAEDPNSDRLTYTLSFRPLRSDGTWLTVVEELEDDYYSFDSTVLPDGRYRFKLEAFDRARQDDDERKSATEITEPVLIDHSMPTLVERRESGGRLEVVVEDRWNPLRAAELSVDAREWQRAVPADGLLDGRRETLLLEPPEEGSLLLLRLTDAAFNVVTIDLSRGSRP